MPRAGFKLSEETKEKIRQSRLRQPSALIGRHGITKEIYDIAISSGKIWCRDCKRFREDGDFGKSRSRCSECNRKASQRHREKLKHDPEGYARYRQQIRDAQSVDKDLKGKVRKKWLKVKYGVTPDWYKEKLSEQGSGCGICGGPSNTPYGGHYCVDHNHETGKVRGLLCHRCNTTLERMETQGWMEKSLAYLARYR